MTDKATEDHDLPTTTQEDRWSKRCVIGIGSAMLVFVPEDRAEEV